MAGSYLFADKRFERYIINNMESEFSNQPERKEITLRNQSSDELLMHVLNRFVPTATLEEIAIIASERNSLLIGESKKANSILIDALAKKIKERLDRGNDIVELERRVRFHAQDERMTESIFDGSDSKSEQRLKSLLEGFNLGNE